MTYGNYILIYPKQKSGDTNQGGSLLMSKEVGVMFVMVVE